MARAAELLTESWTVLIIRELLRGDRSADTISRAITGISPAVLAARLNQLQRAQLVTKTAESNGSHRFQLTTAGLELRPLIEQLGSWGQRWLPPPRDGELDPTLLITDISNEIDTSTLPSRPVAIQIVLTETPAHRHWWLVLSTVRVATHDHDPGVPVAVAISSTLSALTNVWLGHVTWLQAVQSALIQIRGEQDMVRSALSWLGVSRFAGVPRADSPLPRL